MKKLMFIGILLTTMAMKGYSQIEKNTLLLGGNAIFNFSHNSVFYVNPNTGLFVSDRFCLGISLPFEYASDKFYWGLTPFARYYFNPKESRSFYMSGSIGLTSFVNSGNTFSSNALSLGVGHVWLLNKSVGFETELQGATSFHRAVVGLFLGFQIYFNKSND